MLKKLAYFLVGCLVIVVVLYVVHLMLGLLGLPPSIEQFAYIIIGLLALLGVIYLGWQVFSGGPPFGGGPTP